MQLNKVIDLTQCLVALTIKYTEKLEPLLLLIIRLWIANVFWKSGLVKLDDIEGTIYLFQNEYNVPLLPPVFAAYSSMFFELACPVLITLGLAARFAALPLIAMTAIIQFTYDQHTDHFYWAVLLGVILVRGAGFFSVDRIIKWKLGKATNCQK